MGLNREAEGLLLAGAAEQARRVRDGETSARELVAATLEQIARLDPRLNAFRVVRADQALSEAESPNPGPLAGVPVAIKDDTDVAGELTCYGTAAQERVAEHDAPVVARLREAGAVIIGKTHVPELDSWGFTESMTFGATRNPWDPSRSAGGPPGAAESPPPPGCAEWPTGPTARAPCVIPRPGWRSSGSSPGAA